MQPRRLFYDIETSPNLGLFWSPGYRVRLSYDSIIKERKVICICYKWEGENTVHSLTWGKSQNDKTLLKSFAKVLSKATEIVAHNGDNFDEKWLRTRFLIHDIPCPDKFNSFDTLRKARTHFRFNSNRLDYLGQFLTGAGKLNTSFDLWKKIMLNNCQQSMAKMVKYCKKDVQVLESVYNRIKPYVKQNSHEALLSGGEKYDCPKCGSSHVKVHDRRFTAMGTLKLVMKCKSCNGYYNISNKTYQDKLKDDMIKNTQE